MNGISSQNNPVASYRLNAASKTNIQASNSQSTSLFPKQNKEEEKPFNLKQGGKLSQTLDKFSRAFDFEITFGKRKEYIEQINNVHDISKKQAQAEQNFSLITQTRYDSSTRLESLVKVIVTLLGSNLPLRYKFEQLELFLSLLFHGHKNSDARFESDGSQNEFVILGQSEEDFTEAALLVKNLMIILAEEDKPEFFRMGGFSENAKKLLNTKRTSIGRLGDLFGMKSASIKICIKRGLIQE